MDNLKDNRKVDVDNILVSLAFKYCCSVTKSCLTLFHSMDCSKPGFAIPHHIPEFAQVHVH